MPGLNTGSASRIIVPAHLRFIAREAEGGTLTGKRVRVAVIAEGESRGCHVGVAGWKRFVYTGDFLQSIVPAIDGPTRAIIGPDGMLTHLTDEQEAAIYSGTSPLPETEGDIEGATWNPEMRWIEGDYLPGDAVAAWIADRYAAGGIADPILQCVGFSLYMIFDEVSETPDAVYPVKLREIVSRDLVHNPGAGGRIVEVKEQSSTSAAATGGSSETGGRVAAPPTGVPMKTIAFLRGLVAVADPVAAKEAEAVSGFFDLDPDAAAKSHADLYSRVAKARESAQYCPGCSSAVLKTAKECACGHTFADAPSPEQPKAQAPAQPVAQVPAASAAPTAEQIIAVIEAKEREHQARLADVTAAADGLPAAVRELVIARYNDGRNEASAIAAKEQAATLKKAVEIEASSVKAKEAAVILERAESGVVFGADATDKRSAALAGFWAGKDVAPSKIVHHEKPKDIDGRGRRFRATELQKTGAVVPRFDSLQRGFREITGIVNPSEHAIRGYIAKEQVMTTTFSGSNRDALHVGMLHRWLDQNDTSLGERLCSHRMVLPDHSTAYLTVRGGVATWSSTAEGVTQPEIALPSDYTTQVTPLKYPVKISWTWEEALLDAARQAQLPILLQQTLDTLAYMISNAVTSQFTSNPTLDMDSVALLHTATHGNLGSAALTEANFQTRLALSQKQTDPGSGRRIMAPVKYLLVPVDLESTARSFADRKIIEKIVPGSSENTAPYTMQSKYPGLEVVVVADWTDTDNWGGACDPSIANTFALVYGGGTDTPTVEDEANAGTIFDNWLRAKRINASFACEPVDYRGVFYHSV